MNEITNLSLSRKAGEAVIIGDDIIVAVSRVSGKKVTLRISANKNVKITRRGLVNEYKDIENESA